MKTKFKRAIGLTLILAGFIGCSDDDPNCEEGDTSGIVDSAISGTKYLCGTVEVKPGFSISDGTKVVVRPGTTIKFAWPTGFDTTTAEGASLVAEGTASLPITFRGFDSDDWSGIALGDGSTSVLRHVVIDGVRDNAAITGDGIVISEVTIQNSDLGIKTGAFGSGSSNIRVITSEGPIAHLTSAAALRDFPGIEFDAVDNSIEVDLEDAGLEDDVEFKLPATYRIVSNVIRTSGDLHVEAGVTLEAENALIEVSNRYLRGTEEAPITLKGTANLGASSFDTSHEIVYQWVNSEGWGIDFESPTLLQHAKFSNCRSSCFSARTNFLDESDDIIIVSLAASDDAQFQMELGMDAVLTLPTNLVLAENSSTRIRILQSYATRTGTVPAVSVLYYLNDQISNDAGVDIYFENGVGIEADSEGSIYLEDGGIYAENVVFKAKEGKRWQGMSFKNMTANSYIRGGGIFETQQTAVYTDGSVELTDVVLSGEGYCVDTIPSDTTDYAANNVLSCFGGDVNVRSAN